MISQWIQVQEGNHSPMWTISRGNPITEIAHFERMSLDDLSLNSLIFTREQAIRGREGNSLSHLHTLAHSLFFLSDSFSIYVTYFLIFHSFPYFFFSYLSLVLTSPLFCCLLCTAKAFFILPTMIGFYYFTPQLLLSWYGCPFQTTH